MDKKTQKRPFMAKSTTHLRTDEGAKMTAGLCSLVRGCVGPKTCIKCHSGRGGGKQGNLIRCSLRLVPCHERISFSGVKRWNSARGVGINVQKGPYYSSVPGTDCCLFVRDKRWCNVRLSPFYALRWCTERISFSRVKWWISVRGERINVQNGPYYLSVRGKHWRPVYSWKFVHLFSPRRDRRKWEVSNF
jgi:hypothetical protein